MLSAEVDDLRDVFFGPLGLPDSRAHAVPATTAPTRPDLKSQTYSCDSCDFCDSPRHCSLSGRLERCDRAAILAIGGQESQKVAARSQPQNGPQTRAKAGKSQESQKSQGVDWKTQPRPAEPRPSGRVALAGEGLAAAHEGPGAWTDADIARFLARRARLMRWGWTEAEADAMAERLVLRDRADDDRHQCPECAHLDGHKATGWRCRNHRRAQVARELPHDLVLLPQRCPGFNP